MASSSGSGTSSGSSLLQNSGSEEDLMDQRKRKRMLSNRDSARRSRMRKQKHLEDLTTELTQLRRENNQIITSLSINGQHYLDVEAENSVLRAQVAELSHRLQSLNEIIAFLNLNNNNNNNNNNNGGFGSDGQYYNEIYGDAFINNSLSYLQPIMASADLLNY